MEAPPSDLTKFALHVALTLGDEPRTSCALFCTYDADGSPRVQGIRVWDFDGHCAVTAFHLQQQHGTP